ncbi:TPA: deoxyribose-phosphate aldolase [Streptococcus suis]|nr:deoxyribose-phosphate aldolase [Streptococcus suis]
MKLNKYIDHTILKPETTQEQVEKILAEAKEYDFASVCVNPTWVALAAESLKDSDVKVCTVIGFPLGANTPAVKAFETKDAISNGADEIDMVINIGALKTGNYDLVLEDIKAVVAASGDKLVKVIIEACLLTDDEKVKACQLSQEAGADYVKTSTGFSTGGATVADVALMRKTVGPDMGVKASGGARSYEDAIAFIEAGASRIGASSGVAIMNGAQADGDIDLIELAVKNSQKAYVPYSKFPVSAVLVAKTGEIFTGVNIENASFGLTNCAERTAIFKAISEGVKDFSEIIIYGETEKPISPCGACRQVMAEFFDKDLKVTLVAKDKSTVEMTVGELLPYSFTDLT